MANPLCIDAKHGAEHATFGLNQCIRDHRDLHGDQVK
jgi:hypothetical protein